MWPYVPTPPWNPGWDTPDEATIRAFLATCASAGYFVELTLLTDDHPARLPWATQLVERLSENPPSNLLLEVGNEPRTNGKAIDTARLRAVCEASPFLVSSGDYERNGERWWGSYFTTHTPRDTGEDGWAWVRKIHDLLEQWQGDGPDKPPLRAIHAPMVADEPIRPDQAGFYPLKFYTYAAGASLFGGGSTFHFESGKTAVLPNEPEMRCAEAFARGLLVFPDDAPLGGYRRIEHDNTLRTYVIGNHMVRVFPKTPEAPEPGWTPLDEWGIAWKR